MRHASSLSDQARLRCDDPTKYQTGSKELVPLNLGSCMLYDKNPDSTERPEWSKGVVKDLEGLGCKYTMESDTSKNVTRTRCDIRPDGSCVTNSEHVSKPLERLIVKM